MWLLLVCASSTTDRPTSIEVSLFRVFYFYLSRSSYCIEYSIQFRILFSAASNTQSVRPFGCLSVCLALLLLFLSFGVHKSDQAGGLELFLYLYLNC